MLSLVFAVKRVQTVTKPIGEAGKQFKREHIGIAARHACGVMQRPQTAGIASLRMHIDQAQCFQFVQRTIDSRQTNPHTMPPRALEQGDGIEQSIGFVQGAQHGPARRGQTQAVRCAAGEPRIERRRA